MQSTTSIYQHPEAACSSCSTDSWRSAVEYSDTNASTGIETDLQPTQGNGGEDTTIEQDTMPKNIANSSSETVAGSDVLSTLAAQSVTSTIPSQAMQTNRPVDRQNRTNHKLLFGMTENGRKHWASMVTTANKLCVAVDAKHGLGKTFDVYTKDASTMKEFADQHCKLSHQIDSSRCELSRLYTQSVSNPDLAIPAVYAGNIEPTGALIRWLGGQKNPALMKKPHRITTKTAKLLASEPLLVCDEDCHWVCRRPMKDVDCPYVEELSLLSLKPS